MQANDVLSKIDVVAKPLIERKVKLQEEDDIKILQNYLDILADNIHEINENSISKEEPLKRINEMKVSVQEQINRINKKLKENKSSKNYSYKRLIYNFETISKNLSYKIQLLKAKG